MRSKVDLPQPERPSRATISPVLERQRDVVQHRRADFAGAFGEGLADVWLTSSSAVEDGVEHGVVLLNVADRSQSAQRAASA